MKKISVLLFALMLVLVGCTQADTPFESDTFFAMDTVIDVRIKGGTQTEFDLVKQTVSDLEHTFSPSLADSELVAVNNAPPMTEIPCSPLFYTTLAKSFDLCQQTEYAFHPCMGAVIDLWDVTGTPYVPTKDERIQALAHCHPEDVRLLAEQNVLKNREGVFIQLGAAVKGLAAQQVMQNLQQAGVTDAVISLGGNVAVMGKPDDRLRAWNVGIKNPFYPERVAGVLHVTDSVVAVSGKYERYFEKDGVRYHHIFDYQTGAPSSSGIESCAVVSKDGLVADALSTALLVMGLEKSKAFYHSHLYDFEAVLFDENGNVYATDGLKDVFTLHEKAMFTEEKPLHFAGYLS